MEFEQVDLYFGKTFSDDEDVVYFLAYLFKKAREGHLCVRNDLNEKVINGSKKVGSLEIVVQDGDLWYLKRNYECQQILLKNLDRIKNSETEEIQFCSRGELNEEQNLAVSKVLKSPLTFICGGPGTGKTRTASAILNFFSEKRVGICAPTGKATANLRHLIKDSETWVVATLQGLLKKKKLTYLPFELIVVDEGSMIDAFLMAELFSSVPTGAKLVILGDVNQLPPVGVGNFFADLVRREKENVAFLKKCLRVELKEVLSLSEDVKEKRLLPIKPLPNARDIIAIIAELLHLDKKMALEGCVSLFQRLRVLTPQRKGPYGLETLNEHLYRYHKKHGGEFIPIIIKTNDPDSELYNGDLGFLSENENMAYFPNKKIAKAFLPPYEYSYLLSVHKSQGSEFDEVFILLPEGSENFGREMLYTAVTRAKRGVTIFGENQILEKIYQNEEIRFSGL